MKTTRRGWLCMAILVAALGGIAPGAAFADDWDWNYNLVFGHRSVDKSDWAPFKGYDELGVEASWGKADEPLLFATDLYVSRDRERVFGFEIENRTWELNPGLRKMWTFNKRWHPYGGAGPTYVQTKSQRATRRREISDQDRAYGFWLGGGLFFRIGAHLDLGMAVRFSALRDFKIFDGPRRGNATHIALTVGWGAQSAPEK